jgi:hypothetical protein
MLTDLTTELATAIAPDIFNSVGTELCEIVRATETPTGYGGVTAVDVSVISDIPCVFKPTPGSVKYQDGVEYLAGRVLVPCIWGGDPLELLLTDKIRLQEGDGANWERLFSVKDISNIHGVYYDVGVTQEEGNA